MIGIVIVSHSARLAEGVCELAEQIAQGKVRLASAGGTSDPENPIGTDAFRVLAAIESVYSEDGVLVLTDLGSAILSAETALEFLDAARRTAVRLHDAPLVEGAVAAAAQAAAGASITEIVQARVAPPVVAGDEVHATLRNPLGLHARPAARIARMVRQYHAQVTLSNASASRGPVDAASLDGILSLAALQGHSLTIRAEGPDARQALTDIRAFIETGCGEAVSGIGAAAGIAIGPLTQLRPPELPAAVALAASDSATEERRLRDAIAAAQEKTRSLHTWALSHAGVSEAGIFDAQLLLLEDPELASAAAHLIREEERTAESAWQTAVGQLRASAADVRDIASRVLRRLAGADAATFTLDQPSIVAAADVTPSEVTALDPGRVLALCLAMGAANAHGVILARSMGIPVVAGLGDGILSVPDGTTVAVDAEKGTIWISPGESHTRDLEERRRAWLASRSAAQAGKQAPAATRDRRRIRVFANISSVEEAARAVECGAEGIGVVRTEFLFLNRRYAPDEEEQTAAYRCIAEALDGRPLIVRTLDIGGDKRVPYIEIGEEANPFLGWRGIRLTLDRRDLLSAQVRAIFHAGGSILLPMVSSLDEVREAKAVIEQAGCGNARVGVMIETPAAVAIAADLAREAAFFSIGANDLVQYTMAADRTNPRVSRIADPLQPAVLRLLQQTVDAGREAGIDVALCGELAADPLATPLLLGMGIGELSVSAPLIPDLKQAIAQWTLDEARLLAQEALSLSSARAVRLLLEQRRTI
jgi:phosphocarrier protein FPr